MSDEAQAISKNSVDSVLVPTPPNVPRKDLTGLDYSAVKGVSFAESMNALHRNTMEDAHVAIDEFGFDKNSAFFGIYDGHGGRNVAEYLRLHLHVNVQRELQSKGDRDVEECLSAAFLTTDMECLATGEKASGATAAVALIRKYEDRTYVYTANCGDSRVVLAQDGKAIRLTKDHKATDMEERTRIEAGGGFISRNRVMGILAIARSFGDYSLKRFVTAEPFTSSTKIQGWCPFIIIACDGLWDVLTDQEAVSIVTKSMNLDSSDPDRVFTEEEMKICSNQLVQVAVQKGSTDNVSVLVVFL